MQKDEYIVITNLYKISTNRVKSNILTLERRKNVIWELTDRIINANFGLIVSNYRSDKLKRINCVNFRTEVAVKSEKKTHTNQSYFKS